MAPDPGIDPRTRLWNAWRPTLLKHLHGTWGDWVEPPVLSRSILKSVTCGVARPTESVDEVGSDPG